MSTKNYPNLHRHRITSTLPIPCVVQQWICCNIRPLVAYNTFKCELLFKRTSQPQITLTSTEIILHLLFQSPVLFKSLPFLLINYTLTSTNIILHILSFSSVEGPLFHSPLYVTLTFPPPPLSSPLDTSALFIPLPLPSY